ncbi:hypothetical protein BDA96_04G141900 [Sorghum bicolor]|uniref:Uncharacterized protein n=2 Tax=Sorghum bicolor TaxID=4558 RepID=A0A921UIZ8_SORBI|nr:hypothetical protein BDA96_04G141900 [Sorghum bicolor]KXG30089.1 hypothetical protein SORBI_3004G132900 [Sorghum bicolor]
MGKKHAAGGGGWFAAVRKVFRPSSTSSTSGTTSSKDKDKDPLQHGKQDGAVEEEPGEEPEVLLLEHFPASETSAEASNDNEGGDAEVVALTAAVRNGHRLQEDEEEEEELADDMERARALAAAAEAAVAAAEAASRVVRLAALRRLSREERAAVRIQAYYRGYLVRICAMCTSSACICMPDDLMARGNGQWRARCTYQTSPTELSKVRFYGAHGTAGGRFRSLFG